MKKTIKPVETLRVADLKAHPVWQYINDDSLGETAVQPVKRLPVANLTGKLVGTEVRLAIGDAVWALIGNVESSDPRSTKHFLTISINHCEKWFHLGRYHDIEYDKFGPQALAQVLGLRVDQVFPISYDLTRFAIGAPAALCGKILKEPQEKLTTAELIQMAVRST